MMTNTRTITEEIENQAQETLDLGLNSGKTLEKVGKLDLGRLIGRNGILNGKNGNK